MQFPHKMPLYFFYTMVQKSQKWTKTQIKGVLPQTWEKRRLRRKAENSQLSEKKRRKCIRFSQKLPNGLACVRQEVAKLSCWYAHLFDKFCCRIADRFHHRRRTCVKERHPVCYFAIDNLRKILTISLNKPTKKNIKCKLEWHDSVFRIPFPGKTVHWQQQEQQKLQRQQCERTLIFTRFCVLR